MPFDDADYVDVGESRSRLRCSLADSPRLTVKQGNGMPFSANTVRDPYQSSVNGITRLIPTQRRALQQDADGEELVRIRFLISQFSIPT